MHWLRPSAGGALVLVSTLAVYGGCGSEDASELPVEDAGPRDGSTADVPPLFDAGAADHPYTTCSGDLHQVLDANGEVLRTCPPEQGCAHGSCVPACEAAEANKSSTGCDYYAINPDGFIEGFGGCYAAYVVNSWNAPVTIDVDRDGTSFEASEFAYVPSGNGRSIEYKPLTDGLLQPGEVAILFLAVGSYAAAPCPQGVSVATVTDPTLPTSSVGAAFHIETSAPVVGYDMFPYGGGSSAMTSATLLLPSTAWGTNYMAVDPHPGMAFGPPWIAIVASEDDTDVTLSPTADIKPGNGVPPTSKGEPQTYSLSRGQALHLVQDAELVGTPIQSNKPVGVWGGVGCMFVPDESVYFCDSGHQQLPPVKALGYEYVATRYRDRYEGTPESPPWRFVGAVDGTALTYVPARPAGAPTTLESGQVVEVAAGDPFVVRAQDDQHPFYLAGYMTGCTQVAPYDGGTGSRPPPDDCRGDPEFVNVVPPQQYLRSYTFFTDPTYPETELVVVRTKTGGAFHDVTLDCAGKLEDWRSVGDYEWTRVDLVSGDFEPQSFAAGRCDNGRHVITSDSPFGVTVWGWGSAATGGGRCASVAEDGGFFTQCVSYAFPAGVSLKAITDASVPPAPK